jgi:3-dehydroquinate synthetase/shikimate kinase
MTERAIYLVGFSGSGKSTIAKLIGRMLQRPAYDLDDIIVERSGMTIPVIFQKEGEAGFRLRESEALRSLSNSGQCVIATGGGTIVSPENRRFMEGKGWIIFLEGRPQTLLSRVQQHLKESGTAAIRPMLDAVYPLDQIRALKHSRQSAYALSDWTIHTDRLAPEQVAAEVIRAADLLEHSGDPPLAEETAGVPIRNSLNPDSPPPVVVAAGPWPYYVVVDWNHLDTLGAQVRRVLPHARRAAVLTDAATWGRLGECVTSSLRASELDLHVREMATGEATKNIEIASAIHDWFLGIKLRRDDVVVIVGGGAIDDAGGFAASTYMRGVPLVKVPVSLEGMVDSSIGGKTALNHPRARNLIGTFFQPRLVLSDVSLLQYEEPGERRASWAEVVKYAMLEGSLLRDQVVGVTFFEELTRNVDSLVGLERQILLNTIARCVALKAQVVAGDERDLGQYRIFLNYGHTLAHALETATQYKLMHGDAVAIGMATEAGLAVRLGLCDASVERCQNDLLARFGLPTRVPRLSLDILLQLVHSDKKVFGDTPRWILPVAIGRAIVSTAVSEADLIAFLKERSE